MPDLISGGRELWNSTSNHALMDTSDTASLYVSRYAGLNKCRPWTVRHTSNSCNVNTSSSHTLLLYTYPTLPALSAGRELLDSSSNHTTINTPPRTASVQKQEPEFGCKNRKQKMKRWLFTITSDSTTKHNVRCAGMIVTTEWQVQLVIASSADISKMTVTCSLLSTVLSTPTRQKAITRPLLDCI